jgi:adenosine/AMP kinase
MTIEITSPDVEALIRQRMEDGFFKTPEDLIREVLKSSEPDMRTGAALIEAMQACPYPEVEIAPPRVLSPVVRDVTFR